MADDNRRRQVRRAIDRAAARQFYDAAGVRWCVFEAPTYCEDGTTRPGGLFFESDAAVRRVRDFPAHWRTLTDAELEALSWRT
jgi:hypothetical protein